MKIKIRSWLAEREKLPTKIKADILEEREKAIHIIHKNRDIWLPKSQIEVT